MRDSIEAIVLVAERLGSLTDRVVFVGGATLGLLITEPGGAPPRATRDVDLVVEVASTIEYLDSLRVDLNARGFRQVLDEGVICRWAIEDTIVDIMPADESVLGFGSRWYRATLEQAQRVSLGGRTSIRLISPPCFLATKLEAFASRGGGDYLASHDLEDIISVVDGRPTIADEVHRAPPNVRGYVGQELRRHLDNERFRDSLSGQVFGDAVSQARLSRIVLLLERMASI